MSVIKFAIFLPLCFTIASSKAQTSGQDPIDAFYDDCIKKDSSEVGINNCTYSAYGKWSDEMDKYYSRFMKELPTKLDKAALKQSQDTWISYRDAQFKAYDAIFNKSRSREQTIIRQKDRLSIVRNRTLSLKSAYQFLKIKEDSGSNK